MTRAVWNGSLRQTLGRRITLYATGYASRGDRRDAGAFFGVAIPLGAVHLGDDRGRDPGRATPSASSRLARPRIRAKAPPPGVPR
jgi:hypothetical protein